MRETILAVNFTDQERSSKLTRALLPLKLRVVAVGREDYGKPIGYLAGNRDIPVAGQEYEGGDLPGELLVLAGLSSARVDQALNALRRSGIGPIPYKAVLTPTNQYWDVPKLFQEIAAEHEQMKGR